MPSSSWPASLLTATVLCVGAYAAQSDSAGAIDRHALVTRHNVVVQQADPKGALAVGNGEFAFNADVTGLQTFPEYYANTMPIGILSNWGWHSFPNPNGYSLDKFKFTCYKTRKGEICYPFVAYKTRKEEDELPEDAKYLRVNPHRFGLGRIGLEITKADGSRVVIGDLKNIDQKLDLWSGMLTSKFEVEGQPVQVETAVHPRRDEVAVSIVSPLIAAGRLKVRIAFPYASGSWGMGYEDWDHPDRHQTTLARRGSHGAEFARRVDAVQYFVRASWSSGFSLTEAGPHAYILSGAGQKGPLQLAAWFSPQAISGEADGVAAVQSECRDHWKRFWTNGGAIDFSGTADPRAQELERRIVLSQYVTAVNSSGSLPPAETGLICNSWFGKFHMEMFWWHSAHFALWGRADLLERSMDTYNRLLPKARKTAQRQGYPGARWQKMIGPEGDETPSPVAAMLIWQEPHPVHMAELIYRAKPTRQTLERYRDVVMETAEFMASFLDWDPGRKQFVMASGVASADEQHKDLENNVNPTMELGYFRWGLETAQLWRERLKLGRNEKWDHVLKNMAPLPVRDGVYPVLESAKGSGPSGMATWLYGILPGSGVDVEVMRRTLHSTLKPMAAAGPSGDMLFWGGAMTAMCAARLGETEIAVNQLVAPYKKNPFSPAGYPAAFDSIPAYLPVNGGWLTAVAMMAAGWDGAPSTPAPGFPRNWKVRWEGLKPMP